MATDQHQVTPPEATPGDAVTAEAPPARAGILITALGTRLVPGTGNPWRWFFSAIWLVYLIAPVSSLFGHRHGVPWIAGGLAITVAFCIAYVALLVKWGEQLRRGRAGLAVIVVLAALACVVYGKAWLPLWMYVAAATGVVLTGEGAGPCAGSSPSGSATPSSAGSPTTTPPTSSSCCCPSCSSASR